MHNELLFIAVSLLAGVGVALLFRRRGKAAGMALAETKYRTLLRDAASRTEALEKQLHDALERLSDNAAQAQQTDAETAMKEVKTLEEALEDAEDELANLRKKLRRSEETLESLQNDYGKEQSKTRELNAEVSSLKQTLTQRTEALRQQMASQDVMQDVLSSPEIISTETCSQAESIYRLSSFFKGHYTALNRYIYATSGLTWRGEHGQAAFASKMAYFHSAFDRWASARRKHWLCGRITIAFVGEFSAGKTSIINRILSQGGPTVAWLPTSAKATTAIPTYIVGDTAVTYSFMSGDGKRRKMGEETFRKVLKDITAQNAGLQMLIKCFVMTHPGPLLNGVSILDTPGFSSDDPADGMRTIDVAKECDALFWVMDINAGALNQSSLSILKEKLHAPLYIVINKVDTKSESEVQEVEDHLRAALHDAGLQVRQFIRFSSHTPLERIANPIAELSKTAARQDPFVTNVLADMEHIMNELERKVRDANARYVHALQEGVVMDEAFLDSLKLLRQDCETVRDLPGWARHVFTKDRFEMTKRQGELMKVIMERIADTRTKELSERHERCVEMAGDICREWTALSDIKATWKKTNECYEQFKMLSKEIIEYGTKHV